MPVFSSDGVAIAYLDEGEGDPILLIHGFASTKEVNWVHPGWVDTLRGAGRRVIAFDNRGHGASEKLYDPALYTAPQMAEDARRLLDHLGIARADVMGYSMGARISAFLMMAHPERVRAGIFGGLGINMVHGVGGAEIVSQALLADDPSSIAQPMGRAFRAFADQTGSDRKALAACILASRVKIGAGDITQVRSPVLVAVGDRDDIAGSPDELAGLLPQGEALVIPRRDHMTAVGDKAYKAGVLDFLGRQTLAL